MSTGPSRILLAMLTLATFSLSACQGTKAVHGCQHLVIGYSPAFQKALAKELRQLEPDKFAAVRQGMLDYKAMRDACRQ